LNGLVPARLTPGPYSHRARGRCNRLLSDAQVCSVKLIETQHTVGIDANGKPTAIASIGAARYVCSGDTILHATLALARRLVEQGCDPTTPLAVDGVTLARIDMAV